jgi:hypothetical protein
MENQTPNPFRDRFENWEGPVRPDFWKDLEKNLDARPRKRFFGWWFFGALSGVLLIGLWVIAPHFSSDPELAQKTNSIHGIDSRLRPAIAEKQENQTPAHEERGSHKTVPAGSLNKQEDNEDVESQGRITDGVATSFSESNANPQAINQSRKPSPPEYSKRNQSESIQIQTSGNRVSTKRKPRENTTRQLVGLDHGNARDKTIRFEKGQPSSGESEDAKVSKTFIPGARHGGSDQPERIAAGRSQEQGVEEVTKAELPVHSTMGQNNSRQLAESQPSESPIQQSGSVSELLSTTEPVAPLQDSLSKADPNLPSERMDTLPQRKDSLDQKKRHPFWFGFSLHAISQKLRWVRPASDFQGAEAKRLVQLWHSPALGGHISGSRMLLPWLSLRLEGMGLVWMERVEYQIEPGRKASQIYESQNPEQTISLVTPVAINQRQILHSWHGSLGLLTELDCHLSNQKSGLRIGNRVQWLFDRVGEGQTNRNSFQAFVPGLAVYHRYRKWEGELRLSVFDQKVKSLAGMPESTLQSLQTFLGFTIRKPL